MSNLNPTYRLIVQGRAALTREGAAIAALEDQLGDSFIQAVECIIHREGHVLVSGAGASAGVARRLAHLLTCVGAPSLYLDAGESAHGAAGAVTARDVLIAISKGGETDELNTLAQVARGCGAPVIAITGHRQSSLARTSDIVLDVSINDEVDAYGVIPLGSSLAAAAIGDALCYAVLSEHGYDAGSYRRVHPSGAVGKHLGATPHPTRAPGAPEFVSLHSAELPLDVEANDMEWQRAGGISSPDSSETRPLAPPLEETASPKPEFASLHRAELRQDVEAEDVEWQRAGGARDG